MAAGSIWRGKRRGWFLHNDEQNGAGILAETSGENFAGLPVQARTVPRRASLQGGGGSLKPRRIQPGGVAKPFLSRGIAVEQLAIRQEDRNRVVLIVK